MSIAFGNRGVIGMYFGNQKVTKVYFGNMLVWPKQVEEVTLTGNGRWPYVSFEMTTEELVSSYSIYVPVSALNTDALSFVCQYDSTITGQSVSEHYKIVQIADMEPKLTPSKYFFTDDTGKLQPMYKVTFTLRENYQLTPGRYLIIFNMDSNASGLYGKDPEIETYMGGIINRYGAGFDGASGDNKHVGDYLGAWADIEDVDNIIFTLHAAWTPPYDPIPESHIINLLYKDDTGELMWDLYLDGIHDPKRLVDHYNVYVNGSTTPIQVTTEKLDFYMYDPGEYTARVEAVSKDGGVSPAEELTFTVIPVVFKKFSPVSDEGYIFIKYVPTVNRTISGFSFYSVGNGVSNERNVILDENFVVVANGTSQNITTAAIQIEDGTPQGELMVVNVRTGRLTNSYTLQAGRTYWFCAMCWYGSAISKPYVANVGEGEYAVIGTDGTAWKFNFDIGSSFADNLIGTHTSGTFDLSFE